MVGAPYLEQEDEFFLCYKWGLIHYFRVIGYDILHVPMSTISKYFLHPPKLLSKVFYNERVFHNLITHFVQNISI